MGYVFRNVPGRRLFCGDRRGEHECARPSSAYAWRSRPRERRAGKRFDRAAGAGGDPRPHRRARGDFGGHRGLHGSRGRIASADRGGGKGGETPSAARGTARTYRRGVPSDGLLCGLSRQDDRDIHVFTHPPRKDALHLPHRRGGQGAFQLLFGRRRGLCDGSL